MVNRWVKDRPCPVADLVVLDRISLRSWPADCGVGTCARCGITRARRRARLITWTCTQAQRPRFITLTNCPGDWQRRRAQVRDLRRRLVGDGFRNEWVWTTETGSLNGMIHVHAIQHGDYIPQRRLQELWGGRRVDIRKATPRHGEYVSKSASRVSQYISKSAEHLDEALTLNGGRLHHWSRQFFGGPIRDAERRMREGTESDLIVVRRGGGELERGEWWLDVDGGHVLRRVGRAM